MTNGSKSEAWVELARGVVALATIGLALYVQDQTFRGAVDLAWRRVRGWSRPVAPIDPHARAIAEQLPGVLAEAERIKDGGE